MSLNIAINTVQCDKDRNLISTEKAYIKSAAPVNTASIKTGYRGKEFSTKELLMLISRKLIDSRWVIFIESEGFSFKSLLKGLNVRSKKFLFVYPRQVNNYDEIIKKAIQSGNSSAVFSTCGEFDFKSCSLIRRAAKENNSSAYLFRKNTKQEAQNAISSISYTEKYSDNIDAHMQYQFDF